MFNFCAQVFIIKTWPNHKITVHNFFFWYLKIIVTLLIKYRLIGTKNYLFPVIVFYCCQTDDWDTSKKRDYKVIL